MIDNQENSYALPTQRSNIIYNVGSDEPNSLKDLADEKGITQAIHQINQESQEEHQQLQQTNDFVDEANNQDLNEQFSQEEFVPVQKKKVHKKNKVDKRIDDLTYRLALKDEENKRIREEHDAELRAVQLNLNKQKIDSDLERISNIMMQANEEGNAKVFTEATKIHNKLIHQESETEQELEHLKNYYQQNNQQNLIENEYNKLAEERFIQLSDAKELNSPHYGEWLQRHNYYNAYDVDNFDADLANEIHDLKSNYNKFLKLKRNQNYIGTPQYYSDLDSMIDQKFNVGNQQNNNYEERSMNKKYVYETQMPPQQNEYSGYSNQPSQQINHGNQMNYGNQRPNVMPVNRSGYTQNYNQNNLPPLNENQRRIALMMPSTDEQNQPLSAEGKIHAYQLGLLEQMNNGR